MLRGMKNWIKPLAYVAGTAVFLLATAHFTLRHALNTPKFKGALTGFIERGTGRAVDYERIGYSLFPFSLVVQNAVIREKDGAEEFASIREFSAAVDFRAKEISVLRLDRPSIRIVQRADGTFNFSDLVSAPTAEKPAPGPAPEKPAGQGKPAPKKPGPAAPPPFILRQVRIEDARFEFVRQSTDQGEESFRLSDLDFLVRDFAHDQPLRIEGSADIGKSSSVRFEVSGPALADYAKNPGAWPMTFQSRADIRDFADLKAFLTEGTLPFQSLDATLNLQGALSDKWRIWMNLKTPAATETHPAGLELALSGEVSLPAPVAAHLLAGEALPEEMQFHPLPCELPVGAITLDAHPALALLLKHLQASLELSIPRIAYGRNLFEQGSATGHLRGGVLAIPEAKLAAYGGTVEARGKIQLLGCPLAYRLDRLAADKLEIQQALAANGLGDFAHFSGQLHLEASLAGHAVAEPGLRTLEADATARIENLQSVGTGGSWIDQIWMELDHPVLMALLPHLKSKVEQAQRAAATTTTSRYDEATATLALRNGQATLSDARLSMADYRLASSGTILPFDDQLDLAARLRVSPAETQRLADGKDLSAYLPHEDGGLSIPLSMQGPLQAPRVLPDFDLLLEHALAGATHPESGSLLDELSDSDRKNVEKGLQILGDWLQP